ncbi:MAG: DUF4147 domain-containing protein [Candidatus Marinimicrobia bacterium]|nr:DUF4147 domain-containing protein [Candidatus Neomarinimicrobiota bacterium]
MPFHTKEFLKTVYLKSLVDVHPDALFSAYLHLYDRELYYRNTLIPLGSRGRLVLAGSGKAALTMAKALTRYLPRPPDETLLIAPAGGNEDMQGVYPGDHPVPAENSLASGQKMLELLDSLNEHDVLLYLLSGGSSSLFEVPAEGLTIEDIQAATRVFLSAGLPIREINFLRARLSQVKAGRLAARCKANCHVFVLSDVMGNDLSVIASGPFTTLDPHAMNLEGLIRDYALDRRLPEHLLHLLRTNPPPQAAATVPHYLIGSNMEFLGAAEKHLEAEGIHTLSYPESLYGEARDSAGMIAAMIRNYRGPKPACLLFGGETTVTLSGDHGEGGRSQELALAAVSLLKDLPGTCLLAAGSDGIDGTGEAAGAVVDSGTYGLALSLGLSPEPYLVRHDSAAFHRRCGTGIVTGPSGTNLGDLVMAMTG